MKRNKNGRSKNTASGFMGVSKSPLLKHVEYQMNCEKKAFPVHIKTFVENLTSKY